VPDTLAFLDAVEGLPEQLELAHRAAGAIDAAVFGDGTDVDQIAVLGMGGSGIAGDVLAAAANDTLECPVAVLKQYRVPKWVGERTLVFAVSYSGTTEETVSMAEAAAARGARLVAVSRGGDLADIAAACGGVHVECPDGYLPRAAIGALVAPIYVALFRMGLLPNAHGELVAAGAQLARRRDQCARHVEGARNEAREVARKIGRTIPLIYGGGALGGVAAYRWKCDVNENAKAPAFWNQYPEIDHNEICGFGQHGDVTRQLLTLVELRHGFEHSQLARRFDGTREIVEEALLQVLSVTAAGEGRLAQLLDLMYVGDFVSTYLALDNDVDPGPIEAIARLKDEMGGPA
jgi:glucose/mannose-6-phosphate isomerase